MLTIDQPSPSLAAEQETTVFRIAGGPGETVGKRKGGLLCLPNGSFERRDFVESDREFEIGLRTAAADGGISQLESVARSVALERVEVSLCARHFLPGQRTDYSGKVRFEFDIIRPDGSQHFEAVEWKVESDAPMSPFEIFQEALIILAERMTGSSASTGEAPEGRTTGER